MVKPYFLDKINSPVPNKALGNDLFRPAIKNQSNRNWQRNFFNHGPTLLSAFILPK